MEILRLYINLTEINEVVSAPVTAKMLLFNGECKGEYFNGTIMNGGVDTQMIYTDGTGTLSARYIVEGHDYKGNTCRLFIDNNAKIGESENATVPKIITDSQELKWLESANLVGRIENEDGQLIIVIEKVE